MADTIQPTQASQAGPFATIGSLPGYNKNIDPKGDYAKKLLSNINKVVLKPVGYSVDFTGMSVEFMQLLKAIGEDGEGSITNDNNKNNNSGNVLFKIGKDANFSMQYGDNDIGTEEALKIWKSILAANASLSPTETTFKLDPNVESLHILGANDSTFTEVLSNNYKPSFIDSGSTSKVQQFMGSLKNFNIAHQLFTAFDADAGRAIMRSSSSDSDILNMLSGKSLGYQTTLPKEWYNSSYQSGLQLLIRLVAPSGHYTDVYKYILQPLMYLICAASPVTYNGVSYGFPPLWRVEAEGLQTIPLAGISALTISRGGTDTIFNKWNQPLNIDVRMSLESIIDGFATFASQDAKTKYYDKQDPLSGGRASLVTNPKDIMDSFTYLTTNGANAKEISVKL